MSELKKNIGKLSNAEYLLRTFLIQGYTLIQKKETIFNIRGAVRDLRRHNHKVSLRKIQEGWKIEYLSEEDSLLNAIAKIDRINEIRKNKNELAITTERIGKSIKKV